MLVLLPTVDGVLVLDSYFYPLVANHEWGRLHRHNLLVRNGPKLSVSLSFLYCRALFRYM